MPICFGIVKSTSRFLRRPPSVYNPESCRKVSQDLRKYQYHLKSNACWPASWDLEDCDERNSLPDSKVAWRRNQAGWSRLEVAENKANIVERKLNYYILLFGRMLRAGS